jgi:hypothetical protein
LCRVASFVDIVERAKGGGKRHRVETANELAECGMLLVE